MDKAHWDQKCPKCNKESLLIIINDNIIVEQCLLCGYENKEISEEDEEEL